MVGAHLRSPVWLHSSDLMWSLVRLMLYALVWCCVPTETRCGGFGISSGTRSKEMDETAVGGMYYEKNYRKKKQKSKARPGGCRGMLLQTSGTRKNHAITRRMIAMIIAGIPIWAASFSMESARDYYHARALTRWSLFPCISSVPAGSPSAPARAWTRRPG